MLTSRLHTVQWLSPAGLQRLAYREWGDPDNPHVLMCVHGLTRLGSDFNTLAQALGNKVRVVAPDMPGRGGSDWLPMGTLYQIPNYVAACVALVARVNPQKLDWLGTSMGGLIGMGYASLPGNPVNRLILNDVGPSLNFQALTRIGEYVGKPLSFGSAEEAKAYIKQISIPFGPHSDAQWDELCSAVIRQKDGRWIAHYDPAIGDAFKTITEETTAMNETMLWAAYGAITCPTLVIRGEHSDLLTRETAQKMSGCGPKAQVVEVPGVGHAPTFMQPDQISLVEGFLF